MLEAVLFFDAPLAAPEALLQVVQFDLPQEAPEAMPRGRPQGALWAMLWVVRVDRP